MAKRERLNTPNKLRFQKREGLIPFMEYFGPTIQGEGMVIGQKTFFVRTAFCQYSCDWCDSKFTWDGTQQPEWITPLDLKERVLNTITLPDGRRNCDHITLTGGNPGLIGKEMEEFIDLMKAEGFQFSMETQGVNWQDWYTKVDQIVMSPKPPSSGMKTNFRILDKIIDKLNEADANWSLKVVIFDDTDFEYAREVFKRYREVNTKNPFNVSVGNENATEEGDISKRLLDKLEWLWNKVLDDPVFNDVRPLPQLHTLVWANKRGV